MKTLERDEARELRRQGHSIREICQKRFVAKSSVSLWVRDIELTESQVERLNENQTRCRQRFGNLSRCGNVNTNRADAEKRHAAFEQAGYERAAVDEKFRIVCALYWGEGTKRSKNVFSVSNSDPKLLRIILDWLIASGFEELLALSVQYYEENGLREEDIRAWWQVHLPALKDMHWRRFVRCKLNRASQRKKIGALPYGTATLRVCRTELFHNVLGGIKYLQTMGDW